MAFQHNHFVPHLEFLQPLPLLQPFPYHIIQNENINIDLSMLYVEYNQRNEYGSIWRRRPRIAGLLNRSSLSKGYEMFVFAVVVVLWCSKSKSQKNALNFDFGVEWSSRSWQQAIDGSRNGTTSPRNR